MINFFLWLATAVTATSLTRHAWNWFVVPLGLPASTFWHAYGLAIVGWCLVPQFLVEQARELYRRDLRGEKDSDDVKLKARIVIFILVCIHYAAAYFVHAFWM